MNDQLKKKVVYMELIKNRLQDAVPAKHINRPQEYKAFLQKELKFVQAQIEEFKLSQLK